MPITSEEVEDLRRSLKATRSKLEDNTEALEGVRAELVRFNDNLEDMLEVVKELMPLAEGAAAGSSVLSGAVGIAKTLLEKRKARRRQ